MRSMKYYSIHKRRMTMAFIDEKKPAMPDIDKKAAIDKEVRSLVTARGFPADGSYRFDPNPNVQRKDGSIVSGTVKGRFGVENGSNDILVFNRTDFPEKTWRKICTIMGYKYHNHADIDSFIVLPSTLDVVISLATPQEEVI